MTEQQPKEPPKATPPEPKIGDTRPTANPYYRETATGYNADGSLVWRSR